MVCQYKFISACVIFFLFIFLFGSANAKKVETRYVTVSIHVVDKNNIKIYSTKGEVIDNRGLIITDINAIQKWLDNISNNLIVVDKFGKSYNIERLISTHPKEKVAIFSIETKGVFLSEKTVHKHSHKHRHLINTATERFNRLKAKKHIQQEENILKLDTTILPKTQYTETYSITQYKEQGRLLILHKKYQEAEDIYLKVLSLNNTDLESLRSLALINTFLGRLQNGIEYYNRLLRLEESADTLKKLSNIYMILGQYNLAHKYLKMALSFSSFDAQTHYNLALLNILLGDKENAHNQYIKLKRLDKDKAEEIFDILYR